MRGVVSILQSFNPNLGIAARFSAYLCAASLKHHVENSKHDTSLTRTSYLSFAMGVHLPKWYDYWIYSMVKSKFAIETRPTHLAKGNSTVPFFHTRSWMSCLKTTRLTIMTIKTTQTPYTILKGMLCATERPAVLIFNACVNFCMYRKLSAVGRNELDVGVGVMLVFERSLAWRRRWQIKYVSMKTDYSFKHADIPPLLSSWRYNT